MEKPNFFPSSSTVVEGKPALSLAANRNIPLSKDRQEPSFEDVLKTAYEDFPTLNKHGDMHPSEYGNTINLINALPAKIQDKWTLLRLCLWNRYGSSIYGEIFNLTPASLSRETALFSNLPDELTNMVSELLHEGDDEDKEEIAENITIESKPRRYNLRVNQEKKILSFWQKEDQNGTHLQTNKDSS